MPQINSLVKTLKNELKAQNLTYGDVAEHLKLSEASVKRLFTEKSFTLQRFESVCELLGMEFSELVQKMSNSQNALHQLTLEQEEEIAADILMVLVIVCVMNGFSFDNIITEYSITKAQCIQKLARLDRLKLIELLPNNRIKLLIAPGFNWLPNGPIQQFFRDKVEKEFFNSSFTKETEKLYVINALLSSDSNLIFQRKMQKLAQTFNELAEADSHIPITSRNGATMVLALRQWQYSAFESLRRPKAKS